MIVVATDDFELYHDVVDELRDRGVAFTTQKPGAALPDRTRVVIRSPEDGAVAEDGAPGATDSDGGESENAPGIDVVVATAEEARRAVEEAVSILRGGGGRTVVGVDPGTRPGIAVLTGDTVVAAFQVPLADAVETIRREVADAPDPLVRIGDGARLQGSQLVNDLDDVTVELVDETGTTPYLGTGARGMGDVLAAVNIARLSGEATDSREIDPTAGELQRIKDRSREASSDGRTIDEGLARRVAAGELTVDEALATHRERDGGDAEEPSDG
ncbi:hypothetical protein [Halobellus limi]|uniref:Uncharacterized protein n=1 Tax=Halobellus limi TaxID=699433 RepID=A0A1H5TEY6_9EURY|nr:hypothetical protein [Halobellus limi]QCC47329.1 hypothetical protein DV707_06445 [Halobellus limi]SEF61323.1 hypothetical protein SAMN04488133_0258 [Halobellus limi]